MPNRNHSITSDSLALALRRCFEAVPILVNGNSDGSLACEHSNANAELEVAGRQKLDDAEAKTE
jgi:hypothetical protein